MAIYVYLIYILPWRRRRRLLALRKHYFGTVFVSGVGALGQALVVHPPSDVIDDLVFPLSHVWADLSLPPGHPHGHPGTEGTMETTEHKGNSQELKRDIPKSSMSYCHTLNTR